MTRFHLMPSSSARRRMVDSIIVKTSPSCENAWEPEKCMMLTPPAWTWL